MKGFIWLTDYNPSLAGLALSAGTRNWNRECREALITAFLPGSHPSPFLRWSRSTCLGVRWAHSGWILLCLDTLKGHPMVTVLQLRVKLARVYTRPHSYVSHHSGKNPRWKVPHAAAVPQLCGLFLLPCHLLLSKLLLSISLPVCPNSSSALSI